MVEKNYNNNLIELYKLTQEEHNRVLEMLKSTIFSNGNQTSKPSLAFVIGQPGSGKTTFIEKSSFNKDYIIINSDEYRKYHKYAKEILAKYPTQYASLTNYDAHLWGDELFSYGLKNGYNVLREKAPKDFSLLEVISENSKDYDVLISVIVNGNLNSLLATRERYEKEIKIKLNAKLSSIEVHNKCYEILSEFIIKCSKLNVKINYIIWEDNQYKIIPINKDFSEILEKYRQESNMNAYLHYEERIENLKESMLKRCAPKEEFLELQKIENLYKEMPKEN